MTTVGVAHEEGVAFITLQRPDVLNAFNDEMGAAFLDAVEEAAGDPAIRCIAITGSGRGFSSGEDLAALQEGYERGEVPELGDTLIRRYNPTIRALRGAPKPVLAGINGVAAGAGASIALAADFRIASARAKLVLAFIKVGLVPDSGALWLLSRSVGAARAFRLAATGDPLDAQEALELGLLDAVVPDEELGSAFRRRAIELAQGPTAAFALTKKLLEQSQELTLDEVLDAEVGAQTEAGRTNDHLEGVRAFMAKRPPRFTGS